MLPDYPETKALLARRLEQRMRAVVQHEITPFSEIGVSFMHEGETSILYRSDGSVQEIEMHDVRETAVYEAESLSIENVDYHALLNEMFEVAKRIAAKKERLILHTVESAVKEVGNYIGPSDDPAEQVFEMMRRIYIVFGQDGLPDWSGFRLIVGDEATARKFQETIQRIESTPELRSRMEAILEIKRREYHDREATRQLVD